MYFFIGSSVSFPCLLILICLPHPLPHPLISPLPDRSAAVVVSVRERLRLHQKESLCLYRVDPARPVAQLCRPMTDSPGPARLILTRPAGLVSLRVSSVVSRTGM